MSLSILRRQIFKLYFKYVHEIIFAQQTRTNPMVSDVAGHIYVTTEIQTPLDPY